MRILIHSGNFFPEKTGIGKYTGEMAAWLAQQGHEVEVITGFPYYPEWKLAEQYSKTRYLTEHWNGVTIRRVPHHIPSNKQVSSLDRILVDLTIFLASSVHWLRLLFSRRKPDVVIAVCPPLFAGIWPSVLKLFRRVPWIYHVQDFQIDAAVSLGMMKRVAPFLLWIERKLIRSATRVSSITPAMCRRLMSKGADPSRVISLPNWSDVKNIHPISRNTSFRKALNITEDQVLVMYAGAMGKKQGLSLVLDAAERLKSDQRFAFVMIGSGSDAKDLQLTAECRSLHNIQFLELQPIEKLNEMLGSADIHLIIQRAHAADLVMPSKLANILAAGRPAIATADPGTALYDAVAVAQTGLVIAPEDENGLVAALQQLAADDALRSNLSRNARTYAELHLDQNAILSKLAADIAAFCPRSKPHTEKAVEEPQLKRRGT